MIPYFQRAFEIDFDFIEHFLTIRTDGGETRQIPLRPQSVAAFYDALFDALSSLKINVTIHGRPNELIDATPFSLDVVHKSYDPLYAQRFWRVLKINDHIFKLFRTGFLGKSSPVHLFWGSLDLAVTRFSGRTAPRHPGGIPNLPDSVTREAYSHEVSSVGFWAGGGVVDYAAYYSYAYPVPDGFSERAVQPKGAFFSKEAGEFLLPYDAVRTAVNPERTLLDFLESTFAVAAETANWDRGSLECAMGRPRVPREV